MKKFFFCIGLFFLLQSCQSSFYKSANEMGGQPATLYLKNGEIKQGIIEIRSFDQFSSIRRIRFSEAGIKN